MSIPASISMVNVLGPRDEYLRILERDLAADIHVRGNEVTLSGSPIAVAHAAEVLTELVTIIRTGQGLSASDVERVVGMTAEAGELRPAEVLTQNILSSRGKTIRPKTLNQKRYVDAIDAHTVVFGSTASSSRGRPSKRGSGSASCPARSTTRSTRTCGLCTTRSTTWSTPTPYRGC
jgi:phosphate starvation-inducible PhoH-like protein